MAQDNNLNKPFAAPSELPDSNKSFEEEEDSETTIDSSNHRTISDYDWKKMVNDKDFIYRHDKLKQKEKKKKASSSNIDVSKFFNAHLFKIIFISFVVFLLLTILYHIFKDADFSIFKNAKKKVSTSTSNFEEVEVFNDWDLALKAALQQLDYRLAVRLQYLQTLQTLHQSRLIDYQPQKTNWEYLKQMNSSNHHHAFRTLTRYFEHVWYGQYTVEGSNYDELANAFKTFRQNIQ